MRRLLLISLATIPLTGCQFFNRGDTTAVDIIESVESGEALKPPAQFNGNNNGGKAFEDPTVKGKGADKDGKTGKDGKGGTATASSELIRSTDPDARAKAIARSRVDPFASLPIVTAPDVVVTAPTAAAGNGSGGSAIRSGGSAASGATRTAPATRATAAPRRQAPRPTPLPPPVRVQPPNAPLVMPSPIATLPSIPRPVIAPTVSVSGVVQMGNEPYAIVRAGNEPERYVRVGDRIAGGSVRVKRIETLAFEPQVIFEENGIEVARPIAASGNSADESNGNTPEAAPGPLASAIAVPSATIPRSQSALPAMPNAPFTMVLPPPPSALQSGNSQIPNSLLLQPAPSRTQAVLPGFQVAVPPIG
jgi:hypothetical protein